MSHIINRGTILCRLHGRWEELRPLDPNPPVSVLAVQKPRILAINWAERKPMLFMSNRIRLILRVLFGNPVRFSKISDFVQVNVNNPTGLFPV